MQPRPHAGLHICLRQLAGQLVGCLPACAMARYHNGRSKSGQLRESARDNRLEEATAEMQPANKCVYLVYTRQTLRVSQHIDRSCMTPTCEHNTPFFLHMPDSSLPIPHPCINLP